MVGDLLGGERKQGPEGCEIEYPAVFWSTRRDSPTTNSKRAELHEYRLYACPNMKNFDRLVLWRVRVHNSQLVGQIELPTDAVKKVRSLSLNTAPYVVNIGTGNCFLSEDEATAVDALVPPSFGPEVKVPLAQVVYSWRFNAPMMRLEPIPKGSLHHCLGG